MRSLGLLVDVDSLMHMYSSAAAVFASFLYFLYVSSSLLMGLSHQQRLPKAVTSYMKLSRMLAFEWFL